MLGNAPKPSHRLSRAPLGVLIVHGHEAASQLDGDGHVFLQELRAEIEQVAGGHLRHAVLYLQVLAVQETVAADYLVTVRIPHYDLSAGIVHGVEFIDVTAQPRASPGVAEGYLAQTAYLAHHVRRIVRVNYIDFIAPLVRVAQELVGRQLLKNQVGVYFIYNRLHWLIPYTLKRKCMMSPSCTTYSLPSTPSLPASRTALSDPRVT